jgi:hypothetical protein
MSELRQRTTAANAQQQQQEASAQSAVPQQQERIIEKPEWQSPHPPGYNKKRRDIVKIILVIVALGLLGGDSLVSTVFSVAAILCLKEGTFWSTKNLKWMALCICSFAASLISWALIRSSERIEDVKSETLQSVLWASAKIIQTCWGVTLSVFLTSAYVHGHNSMLEFAHEPLPPEAAGPRDKDPPPKTYMLY